MRRAAVMGAALVAVWAIGAGPVFAQQRPLVTEDPETVGAGRLLIEAGVDYVRDATFPLTGLSGNMWTIPTVGFSIGFSSIAELQIDGAIYRGLSITERGPGPLADATDITGDHTSAPDDIVVATKIRMVSETSSRPSFGIRFATKLPNASTESGIGHDTTDFFASLLVGKTTRSIRLVGNGGLAIIGDPTKGDRQDDLLTFGVSLARAITASTEVVGEINGRLNFESGDPTPGAESRGIVRVGGRFTHGTVRLDTGLLIGVTSHDPDIGFTAGLTWVFNAFQVP